MAVGFVIDLISTLFIRNGEIKRDSISDEVRRDQCTTSAAVLLSISSLPLFLLLILQKSPNKVGEI